MGVVKFRSKVDWDPALVPVLKGVVDSIDKLPDSAGGRRAMILDCPEGLFRIYESYDLKEVFDAAEKGDSLEISFQRTKPIKGGKTLKQYNAKLTGR